MTTWIDQFRDSSVVEVAVRLGYEPRRHTSSHSTKCPACGAVLRHKKSRDRRGAVGIPHANPAGWRCFQASCGGDAIDFVAFHVGGRRFRDLGDEDKREVQEWFCGPLSTQAGRFHHPGTRSAALPPPSSLPVAWENASTVYPPRDEVETFWDGCRPVWQDCDAMAYLESRQIHDARRLAEHDCVRVLPWDATCPAWAHCGERAWADSGHRLIVPLYDWQGRMRSVIGRSLERQPRVKSSGAKGFQRRGLVMAGTYGLEMLRVGPMAHMHRLEQFRLSVYEGEVSFLRGISQAPYDCVIEEDYRPAAFRGALGIFSGSFTRDVASRVPSGSVVVLRTDDDEPGRKYAEQIQASIGTRVSYELELEPDDSLKGAAE